MRIVCVGYPSEAILTRLHPREITQERHAVNVEKVGKRLVILHPEDPRAELLLLRNPTKSYVFIFTWLGQAPKGLFKNY